MSRKKVAREGSAADAKVHTDHRWFRGWEFDKKVSPTEKFRTVRARYEEWAGQTCRFYQCCLADALAFGAPEPNAYGHTHVEVDGVTVLGRRYVAPTVGYCGMEMP